MTQRAHGTFAVQLHPQAPEDPAGPSPRARLTIAKEFAGELVGTSSGQMLSAGTAGEGSAGYVALEQVRGTLHGRRGTFVLQHSGTLQRGAPQLRITVVPDSGTDELVGLAGEMGISLADGQHSYDFAYTRAEPSDESFAPV
jgi:hypothetical protein